MTKASPIQTNFTAGEWSPQLDGRVDLSKYFNACGELRNFVSTVQGPAKRRPGTRHVAKAKDSLRRTALIPFEFSVTQAYVIEVGDQYFRFYRDNGRIESGGNPVEIVTPYTESNLFDAAGRLRLKFAQSADVLFLVHPSHGPRKLSRTSHTAWTLTEIEFLDGPYLPTNTSATTITPSATTGTITLTASGAIFTGTDVGRVMRLKIGSADWGWIKITDFTSDTVVTAVVQATLGGTTADTDWRFGAWSDTSGWPATVTFFEERLCFGGPTDNPQRMDMSRSGDFENFAPSDFDGTVVGDHALALTLNANNVNVIRWLLDDEKGLQCGTVGGEWIIGAASSTDALTPENATAKRSSNYGSADLMPQRIGRSTLFLQRAGRKLRELAFVFEDDGFRSPDMTLLAEHVTGGGIVAMAYQQEPDRVLWCVRADGALLGLTFEREQDVVGWSRHVLGGYSDATKSEPAICESVAAIPAADGSRDELWMVVRRHVNGDDVRAIEYLDGAWDDGDPADAFFVDSGLSYDGAPATSFSGLDHLEGDTVAVLADGAVAPNRTVTGSQVDLEVAASRVHVGLPYTSRLRTLRIEAGAADGTAQGKTKRIHRVAVRFYRSLGVRGGAVADRLDPVPDLRFRDSSTPMDAPDPLFTGDAEIAWPGGYERAGHVILETAEPLPCTIVAVMPQLVTQDR
ncbi:MAG: hypothetical protein GY791_08345 [Alphaproteobacteria bacterium]|nr:hypothetical protein [Alphaproteobacteria bacterium]